MKRRILSTLLALCMALSLLPATALALENSESDWYRYRQKWLYTAVADKDAARDEKGEAGVEAGENIRDYDDPTTQGVLPIQIYDLGKLQYGATELTNENKLTLTFKNTTDKKYDQPENKNEWGIVNLTAPSPTRYFQVRWIEGTGRMKIGETSKVEITPRTDVTLPGGKLEDYVLFMDQNSRIGWAVKLTVTVEKGKLTVNMPEQVEKFYGQTLTPADITVEVNQENKTLQELGVTKFTGTGVSKDASVGGVYQIRPDVELVETANYEITLSGETTVNVKPTTPERVSVFASGVPAESELNESQLTGKYINPYSGDEVDGKFTWKNGGEKVVSRNTYQYTFTPGDRTNYQAVDGEVTVAASQAPQPTEININESSLNATYNGSRHPITYTTNRDDVKSISVLYKYKDGAWREQAPVDAGQYDVEVQAYRTDNYLFSTVSAVLTIKPREARVNFSIYDHFYDGETEGQVMAAFFDSTSIVAADKGKVNLAINDASVDDLARNNLATYFDARFENEEVGKNKPVTVTAKAGVKLSLIGNRVENYVLKSEWTATANISPRPVYLNLNSSATKYYGQTMNFAGNDFTADPSNIVSGLAGQDNVSSLNLSVISSGTVETAKVGAYSVSAISGNPNYTASVKGDMHIQKAVPEGIVAPLNGEKNAPISEIAASLQGTFANPYNGEAVPGTVAWVNGNEKIPSVSGQTQEFQYIFTPSDQTNHTTTTGMVKVTATDGPPAPIVIMGETSLTYTGSAQPVTIQPVAGVSFSIKYSTDGQVWNDTTPVQVGAYKVKIDATPDTSSRYIANSITVDLVIRPAVPVVTVTAAKVSEGTQLSESKLTYTATLNGKNVLGSVEWDDGTAEVKKETAYSWTFTPEDTDNYMKVSGDATPIPYVPPVNNGGGSGGGGSGGGAGGGFGGGGAPSEPTIPETDTVTNPDGSTTTTTTNPDGSTTEITTTPDGVTGKVDTDSNGNIKSAEAAIPAGAKTDERGIVTVPIEVSAPADAKDAPPITVSVSGSKPARVEIPVIKVGPGTVAVLVHEDGTEEVVRDCVTRENGVVLNVAGNATLKIVDNTKTFTDVEPVNHWASEAVEFVAARELFNGTGGDKFSPGGDMTRGMLVTVLYRLNYEPKAVGNDFADVDASAYYADAVAWAESAGVVGGYGNGSFGPDDDVTREQIVTILYRYAEASGCLTGKIGFLTGYADAGEVSGWAADAMTWAVETGLVKGVDDTHIAPEKNATRAEVATILMRFCEIVVK